MRIALSIPTVKQIYCENPVIIRNSQLKYLLTTYKVYHTPAGDTTISSAVANYWKYSFPEWQFSPKRNNVTVENMDDCYVINPHTGETFPMYILVPCGHCELCKDKKARDWSFRAICETVTSTSIPLFLTLTYNNKHLPKCGIFKEEIQLFLKRLRTRLDSLGIEHNIRYCAVGEYGSKSKRPHYHMILWNFPDNVNGYFTHISSKLHFVESCWRVQSYRNGQPLYKKNGAPVTESLGFAYCLPCKDGAISYVMKYMKKCYIPPKGKNPLFFLSSRRNGGLGAAYARRFISHYRTHPDDTKITATDPFSNVTKTVTMPAYFRRLYFPTLSQVLPKLVTDSHKSLCDLISRRKSIVSLLDDKYKFKIEDNEVIILRKYWFLPTQICLVDNPAFIKQYSQMTFVQLQHEYIDNCLRANELCRYLYLETYDEFYLKQRLELAEKSQQKMSLLYDTLPPMNIEDIKYNLIYRHKIAQNKEII